MTVSDAHPANANGSAGDRPGADGELRSVAFRAERQPVIGSTANTVPHIRFSAILSSCPAAQYAPARPWSRSMSEERDREEGPGNENRSITTAARALPVVS